MKTLQTILAVATCASLVLVSSCVTQKLWDDTNPRERVFVSASDITEQQLITKNIPYYKSNDELGIGYLIPKSRARQLGDYTIRMLATPITVTVDAATTAATTVVIVGVVLLSEGVFGREGYYPR